MFTISTTHPRERTFLPYRLHKTLAQFRAIPLLICRHIEQLRLNELNFHFLARLINPIAGTIVRRNLVEKELGAPIRAFWVCAIFAFQIAPPRITAHAMCAISALVFVFRLHFAASSPPRLRARATGNGNHHNLPEDIRTYTRANGRNLYMPFRALPRS